MEKNKKLQSNEIEVVRVPILFGKLQLENAQTLSMEEKAFKNFINEKSKNIKLLTINQFENLKKDEADKISLVEENEMLKEKLKKLEKSKKVQKPKERQKAELKEENINNK